MCGEKNINIELTRPLIKEFSFPSNRSSVFSYVSLEEYPIHTHLHMEIVYVTEGSASVKVGVWNFTLHAGEFTIINPLEIHAIYSTCETNKICILEIDPDFYSPFDQEFIFVSPYTLYEDAAGSNFPRILELLKKIFALHMSGNSHQASGDSLFRTSVGDNNIQYEKRLLRSLINYFELHFTSEYFLMSDHKENALRDNTLQANRLRNIIVYFYKHFPQKIQLQDVADLLFVNKYHISHLVKSGLGYTFSDFLQHIRIEKSEAYLLGTDMPISRIVSELGFSSYRYFSQHFKKLFNMTPTEYRKKYQTKTIRYKEISYLTMITESDMNNAAEHFSGFEETPVYRNIEIPTEIHIGNLASDIEEPVVPAKLILPGKSKLYDSPYFPAILMQQLCIDRSSDYERFSGFFMPETPEPNDTHSEFCGLPGNITESGIKKSTFYLQEMLTHFTENKTVSYPGCLIAKTEKRIDLLFYHVPPNIVSSADLSSSDIIKRLKNTSKEPSRKWVIKLTQPETSSDFIIRESVLKTDLDAFSQWDRLGQPKSISRSLISLINDSSSPDIRFKQLDLSVPDGHYEVTLSPLQVKCITLLYFTELP